MAFLKHMLSVKKRITNYFGGNFHVPSYFFSFIDLYLYIHLIVYKNQQFPEVDKSQ